MRARHVVTALLTGLLLVVVTAGAASGAIRFRGINYDPPGDDSETLAMNAEWFTVKNSGSKTRKLTGWYVRDSTASWVYAFPDGFRLEPGRTVKVHTGQGEDSRTDLYWGHDRDVSQFVWNNDGDAARLFNPRGKRVDRCGWGPNHPGGCKRC